MPKNINSLGIIPARYDSTRFPGKPLIEIQGTSMIRRVYEQVVKSCLDEAVVATDDERIFKHVQAFGGRVVMTSPFHKSGTDRCAEVAALPEYQTVEVVVNIQGDEPFIQPTQIDKMVSFLQQNPSVPIVTLAKKSVDQDQFIDPNVVKVVIDKNDRALYFSRSAIPYHWHSKESKTVFLKHIGLYAFRRSVLKTISELPPGLLEQTESLEQLRWLEHGLSIGVALTDLETIGIDSPEDLEKVNRLLK